MGVKTVWEMLLPGISPALPEATASTRALSDQEKQTIPKASQRSQCQSQACEQRPKDVVGGCGDQSCSDLNPFCLFAGWLTLGTTVSFYSLLGLCLPLQSWLSLGERSLKMRWTRVSRAGQLYSAHRTIYPLRVKKSHTSKNAQPRGHVTCGRIVFFHRGLPTSNNSRK